MKISEAIIQNRNIQGNTENEFLATYKGKVIFVTTDHGFGKAEHSHLKRFMIEVTDIKTGWFDVESVDDYHTIKDAIRAALKGAKLIE